MASLVLKFKGNKKDISDFSGLCEMSNLLQTRDAQEGQGATAGTVCGCLDPGTGKNWRNPSERPGENGRNPSERRAGKVLQYLSFGRWGSMFRTNGFR